MVENHLRKSHLNFSAKNKNKKITQDWKSSEIRKKSEFVKWEFLCDFHPLWNTFITILFLTSATTFFEHFLSQLMITLKISSFERGSKNNNSENHNEPKKILDKLGIGFFVRNEF